MTNRAVTLLHIWLAQPAADGNRGVGLAIDALPMVDNTDPAYPFKLTSKGIPDGEFRHGPAIVSAIAVVSPDKPSGGPVSEVIQWSRSLTLSPDEGKHVGLSTF